MRAPSALYAWGWSVHGRDAFSHARSDQAGNVCERTLVCIQRPRSDTYGDDDGVYYYIDERLKLEREPDKSVF